jgi:hypothetical protein
MRERIYEGILNGQRFRYSVTLPPKVEGALSDPARELFEEDYADRKFMEAFFKLLKEKDVVEISEEEFRW